MIWLRRTLIFVLLGIFLLAKPTAALKEVSRRWFDVRVYFGDLVPADSIFGETVASIVRRCDAVYGVNATYFGRDNHHIVAIGDITIHLQDLSVCQSPPDRGYLYMTDKLEIGFCPPKITICKIPAGPILILNGVMFPCYPQNFDAHHWNSCRLRTIIAIRGSQFYIFRIYGSLWAIGKYLHKQHFTSAINLDGGSSSAAGAIVANAFVVFPKLRSFYQYFASKYFPKSGANIAAPKSSSVEQSPPSWSDTNISPAFDLSNYVR